MNLKEFTPANAKRLLFVGSYGVGNLGDEAILSILLGRMRADQQATVVSRSPDETREMHGSRGVHPLSPGALTALMRCDAVILGGGGIFSGLSGRMTGGLPLFLRLGQKLGKPLIVEALGVYPDTPPRTLERVLAFLRDARSVTVRDRSSYDLLAEHKIFCVQVPDPALTLDPAPPAEVMAVAQKEGIDPTRTYVGISPRRVRDDKLQPIVERELLAALRHVQTQGIDVMFLPTAHFRFGTYTDDLHFSRELAAKLDPGRTLVVQGFYHPRVMCGLFRIPKAHLTMRLHAMIFAHRVGRPALALAYADKVADVAREIGVPAVELSSFSGVPAARHLLSLVSNG